MNNIGERKRSDERGYVPVLLVPLTQYSPLSPAPGVESAVHSAAQSETQSTGNRGEFVRVLVVDTLNSIIDVESMNS